MLVNKSMFPIQAGYSVISKMNEQLGKLQLQLGTGQKASSLAEMGGDRTNSLSLRARLTKLTAYAENMTTVNMRLSFLDQSFTTLGKLKSEARTSATAGSYGENNLVMVNLQKMSQDRLALVIDSLNANVGGRYLMGGNVTDRPPVASYNSIMEGTGGLAGYKQTVSERNRADMGAPTTLASIGVPKITATGNRVDFNAAGFEQAGYSIVSISSTTGSVRTTEPDHSSPPADVSATFTSQPAPGDSITVTYRKPDGTTASKTLVADTDFPIGADADATAANFATALGTTMGALDGPKLGRLTVGAAGDTVTVGDITGPFGYKLASVTTTSSTIAVGTNLGSPSTVSVGFPSQPRAGDEVTIGLTMPDGTSQLVTLTATTDVAGPGQFQIGATPAETADNFSRGLQAKLGSTSETALKAASTYAAADDFFSTDGIPRRVYGTPPETATALRDGTADTVVWYTGQLTGDARQSATAQIDDVTFAGYGVRANEQGLTELMRTLAAMSYEGYPTEDPTSKGRFDAMVERQMQNLSASTAAQDGSVESIALELGVVKSSIGNTTSRNTAYTHQLETMLTDVETVSMEETSMSLLALKTRLEASYQVTASVSQLSLVNYLK